MGKETLALFLKQQYFYIFSRKCYVRVLWMVDKVLLCGCYGVVSQQNHLNVEAICLACCYVILRVLCVVDSVAMLKWF